MIRQQAIIKINDGQENWRICESPNELNNADYASGYNVPLAKGNDNTPIKSTYQWVSARNT